MAEQAGREQIPSKIKHQFISQKHKSLAVGLANAVHWTRGM
jgi:hypothetical protein